MPRIGQKKVPPERDFFLTSLWAFPLLCFFSSQVSSIEQGSSDMSADAAATLRRVAASRGLPRLRSQNQPAAQAAAQGAAAAVVGAGGEPAAPAAQAVAPGVAAAAVGAGGGPANLPENDDPADSDDSDLDGDDSSDEGQDGLRLDFGQLLRRQNRPPARRRGGRRRREVNDHDFMGNLRDVERPQSRAGEFTRTLGTKIVRVHGSHIQWHRATNWASTRNRKEGEVLALIVDAWMHGDIETAIEVAYRRIGGLMDANVTGDWSLADAYLHDYAITDTVPFNIVARYQRFASLQDRFNTQFARRGAAQAGQAGPARQQGAPRP